MLHEYPRQQLHWLISEFGLSICAEPKRCASILRDLCPEYIREVNLLLAALSERVAEDLLKAPPNVPAELTLSRLARRLHDNLGMAENFAHWTVESWALSLNFISEPASVTISPQQKPVAAVQSTFQQVRTEKIGHYTVSTDGIALNNKTGLMWLRFGYGQIWEHGVARNNLTEASWDDAFKAVEIFNQQGGYTGFSDWRLPTVGELRGLVDKTKGKSGNYIDTDVFVYNCAGRFKNRFWTSSHDANDSQCAWAVYFYDGVASSGYKTVGHALRFVRKAT